MRRVLGLVLFLLSPAAFAAVLPIAGVSAGWSATRFTLGGKAGAVATLLPNVAAGATLTYENDLANGHLFVPAARAQIFTSSGGSSGVLFSDFTFALEGGPAVVVGPAGSAVGVRGGLILGVLAKLVPLSLELGVSRVWDPMTMDPKSGLVVRLGVGF